MADLVPIAGHCLCGDPDPESPPYATMAVFYMKYPANQGRISSFIVGRSGSEYGLPVAVI